MLTNIYITVSNFIPELKNSPSENIPACQILSFWLTNSEDLKRLINSSSGSVVISMKKEIAWVLQMTLFSTTITALNIVTNNKI